MVDVKKYGRVIGVYIRLAEGNIVGDDVGQIFLSLIPMVGESFTGNFVVLFISELG
jgi:hypothetical protein